MHIRVGDISLFVEVVGTKLRVTGATVTEVPTVIFLHGGPAWDHLALLPEFSVLSDCAQLIFYDHRGLGRSGISDPAHWTLEQWAADLKALITALGVDRPIIFGQSFGGMVAQQFALDYPQAYVGLILSSTAARVDLEAIVAAFEALAGEELARLARSFFTAANPRDRDRFLVEGMPYYTRTRRKIGAASSFKPDVLDHFFATGGEAHRLDFRARLSAIEAPTLVMGGDTDPVISEAAVRELAAAFRPDKVDLRIFEQCGHGPTRDRPHEAIALLRTFITSLDIARQAERSGRAVLA